MLKLYNTLLNIGALLLVFFHLGTSLLFCNMLCNVGALLGTFGRRCSQARADGDRACCNCTHFDIHAQSWRLIQDSIVTNLVDYDDDEREVNHPRMCTAADRSACTWHGSTRSRCKEVEAQLPTTVFYCALSCVMVSSRTCGPSLIDVYEH